MLVVMLLGCACTCEPPAVQRNSGMCVTRLYVMMFAYPATNDPCGRLLSVEYKNESKTFAAEEISAMVLIKMKETAQVTTYVLHCYMFARCWSYCEIRSTGWGSGLHSGTGPGCGRVSVVG
jgi:hypothetical protein